MKNRMRGKDHRELQRARPFPRSERSSAACAPWTMLLPDAAEDLLDEGERLALERHLASCEHCSAELAEAQRGLAWLTLLKEEVPTSSPDLLNAILAQTTGLEEVGVYLPEAPLVQYPAASMPLPEWEAVSTWASVKSWLRGDPETWSTLLQPRLAMTGATAFLSVCLTLNLLGISVIQTERSAREQGGATHSVSTTGRSMVQSLEGLRMALRVESRVSRMRAEMNAPLRNSMEQ